MKSLFLKSFLFFLVLWMNVSGSRFQQLNSDSEKKAYYTHPEQIHLAYGGKTFNNNEF